MPQIFWMKKFRIFEGIRERASLSIEGMPKELETLFVNNLNLDINNYTDAVAKRQKSMKNMLEEMKVQSEGNIDKPGSPDTGDN